MFGVHGENRKQHWYLRPGGVYGALQAATTTQIPVLFRVHGALSRRNAKI